MAKGISGVNVEELLRQYATYDQHVDVVCIFEFMVQKATELIPTVKHFERFPSVRSGTKTLAPDFTILFNDDIAIVGEVASVALHENSIDKLTHQLGEYAAITQVPGPGGSPVTVADLDVLLLVPIERGQQALTRITERIGSADDPYNPAKPPVIAQYAALESKYTIQRINDPANGVLTAGEREHHLGEALARDLTVDGAKFNEIKADRRFINDTPSDLYLATHLLLQTVPSLPDYTSASVGGELTVTPSELAKGIRQQYGGGVRAGDVKRALDLLSRAGLAAANSDGTWVVATAPLRSRNLSDTHMIIVQRAAKKTKPLVVGSGREKPVDDEPNLLDLLEQGDALEGAPRPVIQGPSQPPAGSQAEAAGTKRE